MKIPYRNGITTRADYRDVALRERKEVIMTSIRGISKMIKSRRNILYTMAQFLKDPFNCDQVYSMKTVYERGPVIMKEIAMLEATRKDLYQCMRKIIS